MKTTTLIPNFGTNRMNAMRPAEFLRDCEFIGVPFAGGLSEIPHFTARTINVNDLNHGAMNLASVVGNPALNRVLMDRLDATIFHPSVLKQSQFVCEHKRTSELGCTDWAFHYFVCAWMARNGTAGTDGEFSAGMSIRWNASGGDSVVRFRSATEALADWHKVLRKCTFTVLDCFEFLGKCKDQPGHGIYCDPPWPDDGEQYKHKFTEQMQRRLADELAMYGFARVVVRFGDHPLIRELYPETKWAWHPITGRTQTNASKAEMLIVSKP